MDFCEYRSGPTKLIINNYTLILVFLNDAKRNSKHTRSLCHKGTKAQCLRRVASALAERITKIFLDI